MDSVQRIWRCSKCEKWSHAKKKPRWHKRFVLEEPEDAASILERHHAPYDHLNGFTGPESWLVRCGPFEDWWAVKSVV